MRQLCDGVWVIDFPLSIFGLRIGARATVLQLADGGLCLVSPVPMDSASQAKLVGLGEVTAIVAPNLMHYKHVPTAKALFPNARVYGAPGLQQKRPELPIDSTLAGAQLPGLSLHPIAGMPKLREVVLLHEASRTLITTDLVFHFPTAPNLLTGLYLRLSGGLGKPAQTALLRSMIKDKAAFALSRDELLKLDFDRIVVTHGENIETGAKAALADALAWAGPSAS